MDDPLGEEAVQVADELLWLLEFIFFLHIDHPPYSHAKDDEDSQSS